MFPLVLLGIAVGVLAVAIGMKPKAEAPEAKPPEPKPDAKPAPTPAPMPAPASGPPPAAPAAPAPKAEAPAIGPTAFERVPDYRTKLEDVALPEGWATVNGEQFGILRDTHTGGLAQIGVDELLEVGKRLGVEIATFDEIVAYSDAARAQKTEIQPAITFPTADMLTAAGIVPSHYPTKEAYQKAVDAFRNANMGGEAWGRLHDTMGMAWLKAHGWDPSKPAGNYGKWWQWGAAPGTALIKGWRRADGTWIQEGERVAAGTPDDKKPRGKHNRAYSDYGTRALVKKLAVA